MGCICIKYQVLVHTSKPQVGDLAVEEDQGMIYTLDTALPLLLPKCMHVKFMYYFVSFVGKFLVAGKVKKMKSNQFGQKKLN